MSEIEKAPSLEDYKLSELLETSMEVIRAERDRGILADIKSGQGLNQGIEYFYQEAEKASKEIVAVKDLDKIDVRTVLRGYISSRYLRDESLKSVYTMALERKGVTDIDLLENIIEVSERSFHNVNADSILEIYRKGGKN